MLILFGMLHSLNAAEIVINEVLVDAAGTDAGHEWIELYNSSTELVDLSGWEIQWGTSSYSRTHMIGSLAVEPGEYILLGGEWVEGRHELAEFNFGNAGASADSLRLVNADEVVMDTLVYGSPNTDAWSDDFGGPATSLAPVAADGETIARTMDGVDTDFSGADFSLMGDPSPGRSNMVLDTGTAPVTSGDTGEWGCEGADSIKVNEVMYDPESSDAGLEWVELYNAGDTPVSLGGWSLESGTSSYSVIVDFEDGLVMMPGDFVLVGDELVPDTDVTAGFSLGNAGSSSDAVRLVDCEGMSADTLVYGSPNTDEWVDDAGSVASSLAPTPSGSGFSIARISDGFDTDESATDWMVSETNTPGASNPETEPVECVAGAMDVVINEFVSNPDGTDTDQEWVELYNRSDTAVVLDGWVLAWGKNGTYTGGKTFGGGTVIEADDFILIGGALVDDIDVPAGLDLGNAGSNADAVQLVDCEGFIQDTVIYGSPNDEGWIDDSGAAATSLTETPGSAESAARIEDGVDTDDCGADFVLSDAPTPGMPNDSVGPVDCELGEMVVKINEILPNPEGTDAENEFIELYNPSDSTVEIGGWGISAATSTWPGAPSYIFPEGATIEAGGFTVVGGLEIPVADFYMESGNSVSLGNGSKAPDGVRLEDCTGDVQDTVLYGDPADPLEDLELTDDAGAQTLGSMPAENMSLGRTSDGVDTDNNAEDFRTNMPPSPGEPNVVGGGGSEDGSKGCGCGGAEPGTASSTAEASGVAGLFAGLMLLVGMRRRED
jgi:hypothetical protein